MPEEQEGRMVCQEMPHRVSRNPDGDLYTVACSCTLETAMETHNETCVKHGYPR